MANTLSARAARGLALAALTVACVVMGPTPPLIEAFERIYVVAVVEDHATRRARRRVPGSRRNLAGPGNRRPASGRP